jgi:hypothetical protein
MIDIEIKIEAGAAKRQCGDCQLCCKLLPVKTLGKGAGERCRHQRHHKGCAIHAKLMSHVPECALWNCRWLVNDDMEGMSRPDRAHYCIDLMPDFVTLGDGTGEGQAVEVVQIWCDPNYPEAHRDPGLRAYLLRRAAEGKAAIVRWDNRRAMVVFAPALSANREWNEVETDFRDKEHSFTEVAEAIAR